jgi:transcriptional regulator with XRE-family HTH domain
MAGRRTGEPRAAATREPLVPLGPEVGRRVAALRDARGWRQEDLAARAGVDKSTVSLLEAGKRPGATASVIFSLARALGVPAEDLVTGGPGRVHPVVPSPLDRVSAAIRHLEAVRDELLGAPARTGGERAIAEAPRRYEVAPPEPPSEPTVELVPVLRHRAAVGRAPVAEGAADAPDAQRRQHEHELVGVEVTGDWLAPDVRPGFVAIVDLAAGGAAADGDLVVADVDGARVVALVEARAGEPWLVARQQWEPRRVDAGVRILGTVVGFFVPPRALDLRSG